MSGLTRDVAVVGIGYSPIGRDTGLDPRALTLAACHAAIADAGLTATDVDGIVEYQFGQGDAPSATATQRMLGIPDLHMYNDLMGTAPSGLGGAMDAAMAVASGVCETVLVYRCITRRAGHTGALRPAATEAPGPAQFHLPYGYGGGIILAMAMRKQRRVAELGGSYEDYGQIALNARRWAARNERAVLRQPLTMDDYLAARPVADPLLVLDCDYPVDGACAVIVTTRERAADLPHRPVLVDALAYGTGAEPDWLYGADFLFGGTRPCAQRLWSRASVGPGDVDVAQLYDGFTHITISWIEALGLCGIGEFHDWVGDGTRIGPGGDQPLNTHGGQLAEGRLHGLAFLAEAVAQLRGDCGDRQVPAADVAVVANAHGPQSGAMVLIGA
ncbi:MAG: thiolase family protein [Actinobacteria bacterium]|nr:thiolase family protein [Actinomycetota bacterium]